MFRSEDGNDYLMRRSDDSLLLLIIAFTRRREERLELVQLLDELRALPTTE